METVKVKGAYIIDGKKYISVTTTLGVLDKPGLRYWFGKHGIEKCNELTEKSQEFGDLLHKLFEFNVLGEDMKLTKYNSAVQATYKSFISWKNKHKITNVQPEKLLYSKKLKYAGTCDLSLKLDSTDTIIDYKTLLDKPDINFYDDMFFQVSAYIQAYYEMTGKKSSGGILLVSNNHGYKYKSFDFEKSQEIFLIFRDCLRLKRRIQDTKWKKAGILYDEQGNKNL